MNTSVAVTLPPLVCIQTLSHLLEDLVTSNLARFHFVEFGHAEFDLSSFDMIGAQSFRLVEFDLSSFDMIGAQSFRLVEF